MPNSIGHQDLAALIARQPAVTERWRAHVRNSTFGTIHAASLSFPRPVGASIPDPYFTQLAALDPRALEATGSIPLSVPIDPVIAPPVYDFPVVDRRLKGDRLNVQSAPPAAPEPARRDSPPAAKTKDQASLPPASAPILRESSQTGQHQAAPALPKGDRLAPEPVRTGEAKPATGHRRFGLAPGQQTHAKRLLGAGPRKPVVIAAPADPVAGAILRRAGIAAGQPTQAKRMLGTGPRKPVVVAVPVAPAADTVLRRAGIAAGQSTLARRALGAGPRRTMVVAAAADPVAETMRRRAGLAAAHLRKISDEAKQMRAPLAETADLESARVDLAGPIRPVPAPRVPLAETADLESARADLAGPIAPIRAPLAETADLESARADLSGPIVPQVADLPPAPDVEVTEKVPEPEPIPAFVERPASASAVAEVEPAALLKTPDRFNTQAVEQLAQYANPGTQTRVFFGTRELGIGRSHWESWGPDEIPTVLAPPHVDTEIKRAALDPAPDAENEKPGETIAPKGEVTGEGKRPRTPAERLSLAGAARAKHEKCLANAIYFEARGEVERGQMAVAQVILNRAFSGYYPGNVCDVVYQNAHRHLACQFTFACDNHKDVVRDQPRWEVASRIAADALDGKFWLPEIGKATHYHATYVNPWWVRTMTKHTRLGVHIFYRPTRWGPLDEIPVWGDRLDVTGTIKRDASPGSPARGNDDKRAEARPAPARRSIFDPVEPIAPGG